MKLQTPLLTLLVLISINVAARSPAVDPIMGSSIEEYKEVPPSKAKGYNFNRTPSSDVKPVHQKHDQGNLKVQSAAESKENLDKLALFFIFLPIVASGFAYYRFKMNSSLQSQEFSGIDQHEDQSSHHEDHDDIDYPKAS